MSSSSSSSSENSPDQTTKPSKRIRVLNLIGLRKLKKKTLEIPPLEDGTSPVPSDDNRIRITTVEDLERYFSDVEHRFRKPSDASQINYKKLLACLEVEGETQIIGLKDHPTRVHPVLQLLHERRRTGSKPGRRSDDFKVALSIEGGGMRGCISAGMVAAIHHLGLSDSFDVVYGSSAGSLIGAYFVTSQLPWFGNEIYYDSLTTAGNRFIDTKRVLRAVGLGLLDPRLVKDVITRPYGKPVLDLTFLLKDTAIRTKPLDWELFRKMQNVQPLKIVASGLRSERSLVFDANKKCFQTIDQLTDCMYASMLLPSIAGPLLNVCHETDNDHTTTPPKFVLGNDLNANHCEPLADAQLYEPLPFRSALEEGATHVVVLRTRPDGVDVTGKSSVFERLMIRRFFLKKNNLKNVYEHMRTHTHKKIYARDVIRLNEASMDQRDYRDVGVLSSSSSSPQLMPIAVPPGSPEVTRLETRRLNIFEGVRRGFARAYDALVEDPAERGKGGIVAKECFPDEILEYDPEEIGDTNKSAYEVFLERSNSR